MFCRWGWIMRKHRLHINITDRCNLRCKHCYWPSYGQQLDPSLSVINHILLQFKRFARYYHEQGTHIVTLGGGEPTLRSDLGQIVALCKKRGFTVRLVTNATKLDV